MTSNKKELRDTQEGPTADELKERFKAGSIPLQTDFANLIDVAEHGRKAVGKSKGQTGPADGFTLSSMGRLELKLNADGGVKVDANGIAVKAGEGIKVDKDGVGVKLYPNWGLASNNNGVWVVANENKGITVDKDGVAVKIEEKNGLKVTSDGISVVANEERGMLVDKDGVRMNIYPDYGLAFATEKRGLLVKVNKNKGLDVDKDGIGLKKEQTFQKGMVMMFAGTKDEMPTGWALCDGKEGRPDLQDRFVLGSTGFSNINKTNNQKVTGGDTDKKFDNKTTEAKVDLTVEVKNHVLKIDEIPAHSHDCTKNYQVPHGGSGGNIGWGESWISNHSGYQTGQTGGGKGHAHETGLTQSNHSHAVSIVPPYYILAFIIKL